MNTKKHWPGMFKSKSTTEGQLHQTSNASAMRPPYYKGYASSPNYRQERETSPPKAKPRWNPKQDQIRILESIFNSGMVNPSRDEIKRIRARIEEFGQVSEASVFYWFQNRKSKTKRVKQRQLQTAQKPKSAPQNGPQTGTLYSSSSTSSLQSKPITDLASNPVNSMHSNIENQPPSSASAVLVSSFASSPVNSMHNNIENKHPSSSVVPMTSFGSVPVNSMHNNIGNQPAPNSSSAVPRSSFVGHHDDVQAMIEEMRIYNELMNLQAFEAVVAAGDRGIMNDAAGTGGVQHQSINNAANPLITVFINDMPIEIPMGPITFRDFFEDNSMLFHSSGQPVMVNERGLISEGLVHGATYFLI